MSTRTHENASGWTEAQLDWIRHLERLNADRLENPVLLSALDISRLKWEIKVQRLVLLRITVDKPLDGALIPVARYMLAYADLHIAWYAGQLSSQAMREALLAAKGRMWTELKSESLAKKGASVWTRL